jgi:DNA-binding transcriptional ArsR family regulator
VPLDSANYLAKLPNSAMPMIAKDMFVRRAKVLKAMAHPSRLAMLAAMADGERCVCDLRSLVGGDISTVSKHLLVLRKAGLVDDRKDGLWVHYSLRTPCVLQFMDCIDPVIRRQPAVCCRRK